MKPFVYSASEESFERLESVFPIKIDRECLSAGGITVGDEVLPANSSSRFFSPSTVIAFTKEPSTTGTKKAICAHLVGGVMFRGVDEIRPVSRSEQ